MWWPTYLYGSSFIFPVRLGRCECINNWRETEEAGRTVKKDEVSEALQNRHRTMDKARFDPEDAILDLDALVKVAKLNNHTRARADLSAS